MFDKTHIVCMSLPRKEHFDKNREQEFRQAVCRENVIVYSENSRLLTLTPILPLTTLMAQLKSTTRPGQRVVLAS